MAEVKDRHRDAALGAFGTGDELDYRDVAQAVADAEARIVEHLWVIAERMRQENTHGCHAITVAIGEIDRGEWMNDG